MFLKSSNRPPELEEPPDEEGLLVVGELPPPPRMSPKNEPKPDEGDEPPVPPDP